MQIMCLNGWGGKMHAELLAYVAAQQPDILCLQEVVHSPATDKDWLTYRDGDHGLPLLYFFGRVSLITLKQCIRSSDETDEVERRH